MSPFLQKVYAILKELHVAKFRKNSRGVGAAYGKLGRLIESELSGLDEIEEMKRLCAHVEMERMSQRNNTEADVRGSGTQEVNSP